MCAGALAGTGVTARSHSSTKGERKESKPGISRVYSLSVWEYDVIPAISPRCLNPASLPKLCKDRCIVTPWLCEAHARDAGPGAHLQAGLGWPAGWLGQELLPRLKAWLQKVRVGQPPAHCDTMTLPVSLRVVPVTRYPAWPGATGRGGGGLPGGTVLRYRRYPAGRGGRGTHWPGGRHCHCHSVPLSLMSGRVAAKAGVCAAATAPLPLGSEWHCGSHCHCHLIATSTTHTLNVPFDKSQGAENLTGSTYVIFRANEAVPRPIGLQGGELGPPRLNFKHTNSPICTPIFNDFSLRLRLIRLSLQVSVVHRR